MHSSFYFLQAVVGIQYTTAQIPVYQLIRQRWPPVSSSPAAPVTLQQPGSRLCIVHVQTRLIPQGPTFACTVLERAAVSSRSASTRRGKRLVFWMRGCMSARVLDIGNVGCPAIDEGLCLTRLVRGESELGCRAGWDWERAFRQRRRFSAAIKSLEARSRGSRQGWRRGKTMIGHLQEGWRG